MKKIKNKIIEFNLKLMRKLLSFSSLKFRYKFFENLGLLAFIFIKERRKITIENIKNAFPEKSEKEIVEIAKNSYKTMGKMVMTSIFLKDVTSNGNTYIENEKLIKEIADNHNKGIILVSLHLGGFEAGSILKKISPFYAVFRRQKNEKINELMTKWRFEGGLNPLVLHDTAILNETLNNKSIVALASDHHGNDVELEYFGRKVTAVSGPVLLSLKKKLPVIFAYSLFDENNKIKIVVDKIIEIEKKENIRETIKYNMQKIYYDFERVISQNPEQYMWQHKRWKKFI